MTERLTQLIKGGLHHENDPTQLPQRFRSHTVVLPAGPCRQGRLPSARPFPRRRHRPAAEASDGKSRGRQPLYGPQRVKHPPRLLQHRLHRRRPPRRHLPRGQRSNGKDEPQRLPGHLLRQLRQPRQPVPRRSGHPRPRRRRSPHHRLFLSRQARRRRLSHPKLLFLCGRAQPHRLPHQPQPCADASRHRRERYASAGFRKGTGHQHQRGRRAGAWPQPRAEPALHRL